MAAAEETRSIDVGGRRLAYRVLGAGPPLVLLNGYAATSADWDPSLLAALGGSFEVLCPDHRGTGASELGDPGELSVDGMAADVAALLDARGIEKAPVAAWSMGGFVAQRLAARASALVLMGTDPGGAAAVPAEAGVWARLVDHGGTPREQASRLLALIFPASISQAVDEQFGDLVAAARAQLAPETLSAQEQAMAAWHVAERPPPGDDAPPVLVLHGEADVVIPPANADALAARWPGARVERFPGGGHAFMAQEPARVAGLIEGFV